MFRGFSAPSVSLCPSLSLHPLLPVETLPPERPRPAPVPNLARTAGGDDRSETLFTTSAAALAGPNKQPSHTPGAASLHGWHHLTLRYFPGVCPRMMRLSLLCMCQMNHKPIPYAIAICWWAQAVLVDIKSRDYGGLILSEWREREGQGDRESEGGKGGGWRSLPALLLVHRSVTVQR